MKRRIPLFAFAFGLILGIGWVASANEAPDDNQIIGQFPIDGLTLQ